MERRLSKKDLMKLYGVDRVTIEDWRRNRGLNMIEVSTHSKYITEKDLLEWEEGLKGSYSVKRLDRELDQQSFTVKFINYHSFVLF